MKVYLVGGAIRDKLLNIDVYDKDWVVVGANFEQMIDAGFTHVGKNFPVFLHPKTKQEYALARTERKIGLGYTKFECSFSDVTLQEDLLRRDLTINAMAEDNQNKIIDPYGGLEDINNKILRHVSNAFIEDPLRVFRVARFAAKLAHLGFSIANETLNLMCEIVKSGEIEHLSIERIWQEWYKSLSTQNPQIFLQVLKDCDALKIILPEVDLLFNTFKKGHKISMGTYTLTRTKKVAKLSKSPLVRFATQLYDLGKNRVVNNNRSNYHIQEEVITLLCQRIKVPNKFKDFSLLVCKQSQNIDKINNGKTVNILNILNAIDVWRKPKRLNDILFCYQANMQAHLKFKNKSFTADNTLKQAYKEALHVRVKDIIANGFKGEDIKKELNKKREEAILQLNKI